MTSVDSTTISVNDEQNQNDEQEQADSYSVDDLFDDDYDSDSEGEDIVLDDEDDDQGNNDQKDDADDEDDMYDDEEDVAKSSKNSDSLRLDFIDNSRINNDKKSRVDDDDDDDDDDDSHLFSLRRKNASKLGSNDAIKIISTPHGKVGIVYQSNDGADDLSKKGTNESIDKSRKITPVLTPDGKVALLYRGGASGGSTKYEPIQNLTNNEFMTKFQDNKTSSITNSDDDETTEQQPITVVPDTTTTTISTTTVRFGNFNEPNEEENSILPNINRPLSEVLGIKKNQFTQFRITDRSPTATPSLSGQKVDMSSTTSNKIPDLPNYDYDYGVGEVENDVLFGESNKATATDSPIHHVEDTIQPTTLSDVLTKTEVINLAIIPAFESDLQLIQQQELEQQQHSNHHRKHHRHRHRHMQDLTAIHCAMQAMVAIAAMATIFGMLGAYFKTRILDQITIMHW